MTCHVIESTVCLEFNYMYILTVLLCREFFLRASTVDPPGKKLGIDEYSEVTRLTKPVIYISVKEICSTHSVSHK